VPACIAVRTRLQLISRQAAVSGRAVARTEHVRPIPWLERARSRLFRIILIERKPTTRRRCSLGKPGCTRGTRAIPWNVDAPWPALITSSRLSACTARPATSLRADLVTGRGNENLAARDRKLETAREVCAHRCRALPAALREVRTFHNSQRPWTVSYGNEISLVHQFINRRTTPRSTLPRDQQAPFGGIRNEVSNGQPCWNAQFSPRYHRELGLPLGTRSNYRAQRGRITDGHQSQVDTKWIIYVIIIYRLRQTEIPRTLLLTEIQNATIPDVVLEKRP
jgi:hypothetical protein